MICLEKDGTAVDDEDFFKKMSEQTRFIAKEIPFTNEDCKKFQDWWMENSGMS